MKVINKVIATVEDPAWKHALADELNEILGRAEYIISDPYIDGMDVDFHRALQSVVRRVIDFEEMDAECMEIEPLVPEGDDPMQLVFIRQEDGDSIVQCPKCKHIGALMADFSLLAAGFNGIKAGSKDACNLQECGKCDYRARWDLIPEVN